MEIERKLYTYTYIYIYTYMSGSVDVQPFKKDVQKNVVIEKFRTRKLCSRNQPCHERDQSS